MNTPATPESTANASATLDGAWCAALAGALGVDAAWTLLEMWLVAGSGAGMHEDVHHNVAVAAIAVAAAGGGGGGAVQGVGGGGGVGLMGHGAGGWPDARVFVAGSFVPDLLDEVRAALPALAGRWVVAEPVPTEDESTRKLVPPARLTGDQP